MFQLLLVFSCFGGGGSGSSGVSPLVFFEPNLGRASESVKWIARIRLPAPADR
jgi:hypothetical protein